MKKLFSCVAAAAALFIAQQADAYTVEIRNLPPTAEVGQQFTFEYWINNLGPDEYISSYNVWISLDGNYALEVPNSLVFGTSLNGGAPAGSLQKNHGWGEFAETSYLAPDVLRSLQGESFMLARFRHDALLAGDVGIALGVNTMAGSAGLALEDRSPMRIELLNAGVTPVPEPETYAMLLAGLAMLGAARTRRRHDA